MTGPSWVDHPGECCPGLYYPEPLPDAQPLRCDARIVVIGDQAYALCEQTAADRFDATRDLGDRGGVTEGGTRYTRALLGALGEWAVAFSFGIPFDPKPFGLDVGSWNVRTRAVREWDLIVQDPDRRDHPDVPYILVTAIDAHWGTFIIRGWMTPREVRDEWRKAYGGHNPAYFVPQADLHDLRRLT